MLVGCAKVIGMPVASLVDAVTSFFEYFSFFSLTAMHTGEGITKVIAVRINSSFSSLNLNNSIFIYHMI